MRTWIALPCLIALSIAGLHCGDDDDAGGPSVTDAGAAGSAGAGPGGAGGSGASGGAGGSSGSGGGAAGSGGQAGGGGAAGYGGSGVSGSAGAGGEAGAAGAAAGGVAGSTAGGAAGSTASEVTLSEVQSTVFDSTAYECSTPACHGGKQALNLTMGKSYNALVNQSSTFAAGQTLVVPGDPESSVLYKILLGPVGKAGRMPDNGVKATGSDIELVRSWIASGAKDN